jgi:hypothetical protein
MVRHSRSVAKQPVLQQLFPPTINQRTVNGAAMLDDIRNLPNVPAPQPPSPENTLRVSPTTPMRKQATPQSERRHSPPIAPPTTPQRPTPVRLPPPAPSSAPTKPPSPTTPHRLPCTAPTPSPQQVLPPSPQLVRPPTTPQRYSPPKRTIIDILEDESEYQPPPQKRRVVVEIEDDVQEIPPPITPIRVQNPPQSPRKTPSYSNEDMKKLIEHMDEQSIRHILLQALDKDPNALQQILSNGDKSSARDEIEKRLDDVHALDLILNDFQQRLFANTQRDWMNGHEQQHQIMNLFCWKIHDSYLKPIREISLEYQYGFDSCQKALVRIMNGVARLRRVGTRVSIDSDLKHWDDAPQNKEFLYHLFKTWYDMLLSAQKHRQLVDLESLLDWVATATEFDTFGHLKQVRNATSHVGEPDNLFDYTLCQISMRSFKQDPTWYQFHKILYESRPEHQDALKKGMIDHLKSLPPPIRLSWMKSKYQLQPLEKREAADTVLVKILIREGRLQEAISFAELRDAQNASDGHELLLLCASYAIAEDEKWVYKKARIIMERLATLIPSEVKKRVSTLMNQRWANLAISSENATAEQIDSVTTKLDAAYDQELVLIEAYTNQQEDDAISVEDDNIEPYEFPDYGQLYLRWSKLAQCVCGIMKPQHIIKEEFEDERDTVNPYLPDVPPLPKQCRVLNDGKESWRALLSRLCMNVQKEAGLGLLRATEALYNTKTFSTPSIRNEEQMLGKDMIMVLRMTHSWVLQHPVKRQVKQEVKMQVPIKMKKITETIDIT